MFAVLSRLSLPLLLKELLEQAARRRTYIIRVVYAMLFFLACLTVILPELSRAGNSALSVLGIGRNIFIGIVGWQFAGIYLFLPVLACSVLTVEKERNTLGLLFLTKLGPWTIIFEKLLSRLLPMYCLLFCSLPLLAFSMSFGGVNLIDLFVAVWFLALTAFQICSIAVACSSFFRTTTGALLSCYAAMFIMGFGLPILDWLIFENRIHNFLMSNFGVAISGGNAAEILMLAFVGFVGFITQVEGPLVFSGYWQTFYYNSLMAIPLIASGLLALLIARLCLVRRAFIPASNYVLYLLRLIDRCFHALNKNCVTRGIVVLEDATTEPYFSPIAWRETHKRSLGQTRYLIRVLMALELPVLMVILGVIWRSANDYNDAGVSMVITTMLVWVVSALLITVTSAGLIAGERSRQTMDILLTLPIEGRKIILDKIAGVCRLAWVCALPLVTCIVFEAWWRDVMGPRAWGGNRDFLWWEYLLTELSMVVVYVPLMVWVSLWIGLKVRSPTRATLTALVALVAWCIAPLLIIFSTWELFLSPGRDVVSSGMGMVLQFSPVFLYYQAEFESLHDLSSVPLLPMIFNMFLYGACLLVVRSWVLSSADQLLGRTKPKAPRSESNDWDEEPAALNSQG